jgi:hypothetical protein
MERNAGLGERNSGPSVDVRIATRQKLILSGLYLAKYDSLGLKRLGFESFSEAFNVIGYALGSKPASVKNYRDEFDPLFEFRKGWHKRPIRKYCREVFEEHRNLDFESFTGLVQSFFDINENALSAVDSIVALDDGSSAFSQRLITGLAAERYFELVHPNLSEFEGLVAENTTRFGCGYDFRLHRQEDRDNFLAVEVKGLKEEAGSLSMTPKEYDMAGALGERFYLFVVKNFRDVPSHIIFRNPLSGVLQFRRSERLIVQVSWLTAI